MPYIDFRFSNLCNFKCRTCGPDLSSSWYEDHNKMWNGGAKNKIIRPYKDEKRFLSLIAPDDWSKNKDVKYIASFKQDSRQKWNKVEYDI